MADFRRLLYALAVVALLAGFTVTASAQAACFGAANNPLVRGEDYTALAGDIFIQCVGGFPTAPGAQVPKVNVTVFTTSTTITSKITDASVTPAFNEALLIMDQAGGTSPNAPGLLNCGNASAPYSVSAPYICDVTGTGTGAGVYDGTSGRPNVFQARQVGAANGTAIQFIGVPLDSAGTDIFGFPISRTFRITNLRYNAVALGVTGTGAFPNAFFNTTVNFNATNFGGSQFISVVNGTVRSGLVVSSSANASPANFLQCTATAGNAKKDINLTEGFSTAFKARNWRQIQDNGISSGFDWNYNGTTAWDQVDVNQNVPNALYFTESGLMFPPGVSNPSPDNPPSGTGTGGSSPGGVPFSDASGSPGGIDKAGTVTQGTRFAIRFSAAPAGSNPSVPNFVNLTSGGITTGVMALVLGADANGAGGLAAQTGGTTLISALPGDIAVYEVLFSNPNAIETATITVTVAPAANPEIAGLTATASFAPFYAALTGADLAAQMTGVFDLNTGSFPVPRFLDSVQGPVAVYDYITCATSGTIQATTNLAAAAFTITGPATYTGSGISFTQNDAPAGDYTITFGPVPHFLTPPPQTATLNSGQTLTFNEGVYTPITLKVCPASSPQCGTTLTQLAFSYRQGSGQASPQQIVVSSNAPAIAFTAVASTNPADGQWLSIAPSSGTTPLTLTLTAASKMKKGTYFGNVSIVSSDATNSPQQLSVKLTVVPPNQHALPNSPAIYAAGDGGVFKSTDGGANWAAANSGLNATRINALAIDPSNPATLYAGASSGVFKSTDGGQSWAPTSSGLTDTIILSLAIDPDNPNTVYAGTATGAFFPGNGVFKTTDGGQNWAVSNSGLPDAIVDVLGIDPANPAIVYAGTNFAGVFKSANGGQNWTAANSGITSALISSLAVDPANSATLYAGIGGCSFNCLFPAGVMKSTNGGINWNSANVGITDLQVVSLAVDPSNTNILYAGTRLHGLFKSVNAGANWNLINPDLLPTSSGIEYLPILIDPLNPGIVYVATDAGVFRSIDSGVTWFSANNGLPAPGGILALAIEPPSRVRKTK